MECIYIILGFFVILTILYIIDQSSEEKTEDFNVVVNTHDLNHNYRHRHRYRHHQGHRHHHGNHSYRYDYIDYDYPFYSPWYYWTNPYVWY